jgi:mercuric ion transport protein
MTDGKFIGLGGVGLLAVICCAAPFLLVAAGSLGVSAWFAAAGYVLIPIALAAIGVAAFYLYRRRHSGSAEDAACCGSSRENKDNLNV